MKETKAITLDVDILKKVEPTLKEENRTLSNYIETLIRRDLKK